jgi:hypothetical protein
LFSCLHLYLTLSRAVASSPVPLLKAGRKMSGL